MSCALGKDSLERTEFRISAGSVMLKTNCESIVSKVSFISDFLRAIKPQITITAKMNI